MIAANGLTWLLEPADKTLGNALAYSAIAIGIMIVAMKFLGKKDGGI